MWSPASEFVSLDAESLCSEQRDTRPPMPDISHQPSPAVDVRLLPSGTELVVETCNSRYRVVMLDQGPYVLVQGGRYFRQKTEARLEGSALGGGLLKAGWIVLGLCMEVSHLGKRIVTSRVRSISVNMDSPADDFAHA